MKSSELKNMIKEAVKEAIQEELKDILLEAVKAPKASTVAVVQESVQPQLSNSQPQMSAEQRRNMYEQALNETTLSFNSSQAQTFRPPAGYDPANGTLPSGEVDMSQIMNLMSSK